MIDPIRLEVLRHRFESAAEEMLEALRRAALSPNIRERRDHSAAVMDAEGRMVAHAAAIPVHLGSQPLSVEAAMAAFSGRLREGDGVLLNDPFQGGTHLPDLTLVTPVFLGGDGVRPAFFVSTRAHHADVGGLSPGSLPLSREVFHEGLRLPPVRLVREGRIDEDIAAIVAANSRTPEERRGDLLAQAAANALGARRLAEMCRGDAALAEARAAAAALMDHGEALLRAFLRTLPRGTYTADDALESDGLGSGPIPVRVAITIGDGEAEVDFAGTAPAVAGPLNANRAIVLAAVLYAFRVVAGATGAGDMPANGGLLRPLRIRVPAASILDPPFPAAVAGGNVETSQRLVDVLLRALALAAPALVPACSQGTMNNLTLGGRDPRTGRPFAYYETICGGAGASPRGPGASAIQVHMTNTWNTPVEALERAYPLRVSAMTIRRGSGGAGAHEGGDGIVREIEALTPCEVTLLAERRISGPPGLMGGAPGAPGRDAVVRAAGAIEALPSKASVRLERGDRIRVETPGGGGWGAAAGGPA